MPKIAIIDDKLEFRETIQNWLDLKLPEHWSGLAAEPLPDLSSYPAWLLENEIAVLLLDERLTDEPLKTGEQAGYEGHELLKYLRERMADFPIYIITALKHPEDIESAEADADDIMEKKRIFDDVDVVLPRLLRSGHKWHQVNQDNLARVSELSTLVALGTASAGDVNELRALRATLPIADPVSEQRIEVLQKLEVAVEKLRSLMSQLTSGGTGA